MQKFSIFEIVKVYALVFFVSECLSFFKSYCYYRIIVDQDWRMGTCRKDKYSVHRRRFGQACGRRSKKSKLREKAYFLKQEEKIKVYRNDKMKYQPYQ